MEYNIDFHTVGRVCCNSVLHSCIFCQISLEFRTEIIVWFVDIGLTAELRYNGNSGERKRLDQG